ncbi:ABC transporter substrate-binding protein [Candidatus Epulonipiscium viviparus]|uniref:ABC transporter substrate-binding protein n=1 Tax=Candidatus Epulonipiscium viviparus TaxID=420336 RepID=UPI0027381044|nr:ABC transporter substrate-binding protein [Candidatus Epulopiscium viviparus]
MKKYLFACMALSMTMVGCSSTASSDDVILKAHFIGAPPADEQIVEDKLNEYLKANFGFGLEMVFTDFGDFDQKSQLIINSGEDYDIIFTCAWANDYQNNALKGAFLNLTPYLESPEYQELYETIDEGFWDGARVNGSIYAVPTQKEIALMPMYQFNKAYVEAADFDYQNVTKLSDVEPYLEFVKNTYPEAYPMLVFGDRIFGGTYDYLLGFEYPLAVDNNGKVVYMYDLPEVREHVITMGEFFEKGYVNLDAATRTGRPQLGEAYGLGLASGQPFAEVTWSLDSGYDIVAAELAKPIVTTSSTRGAMMGINQNSEHPEEALDLLQIIATDSEFHNLLNYGIEGVHYEKISDTQIERTEAGLGRYAIPSFSLGNLFNTYTLKGEPENKWEVFQQENDEAYRSPLLGFAANISDLKTELAAMNNLRAQYEPLIQTGSVDVETYIEEFRTKLNEVGMQKVIDQMQVQVDDFLK